MTQEVRPWRELHDQYRGGGLIVGNGTSRAFNASFSYESLYGAAREQGHLDEEARTVFEALETQDFEQVLRDLGTSARVIQALGGDASPLNNAYGVIRDALINTVRQVHPTHAQVVD